MPNSSPAAPPVCPVPGAPIGEDTSGIDEAIAKLEDFTDAQDPDSDGGAVDN
jgi:hypothetical protein